MLDLVLAYTRYRFLGNEFLTWLWYLIENGKVVSLLNVEESKPADPFSLRIGNRLVLENRQNEGLETITIRGDDAGLEEGVLALRKGALVSESNLRYSQGSQQWTFTLKGESLNISNLKYPDPKIIQTKTDLEAAALDKILMTEKIIGLVESFFCRFVRERLSPRWDKKTLIEIHKWIYS